MRSVFHDIKVVPQVIKAADAETLNGDGVDLSGYEGVAFVAYAVKGEVADFGLKAQQDSDSAFGTAADLAGTGLTFSTTVDADAHAVLDIYQPRERYVRPVVTAPDLTTAKSLAVVALLYRARSMPVGNTGEFHLSPVEGTA